MTWPIFPATCFSALAPRLDYKLLSSHFSRQAVGKVDRLCGLDEIFIQVGALALSRRACKAPPCARFQIGPELKRTNIWSSDELGLGRPKPQIYQHLMCLKLLSWRKLATIQFQESVCSSSCPGLRINVSKLVVFDYEIGILRRGLRGSISSLGSEPFRQDTESPATIGC